MKNKSCSREFILSYFTVLDQENMTLWEFNISYLSISLGSRYWPYGSEGCQTHGFQGFMTALASLNFIAAIAWDRYHQYCTSKLTL